jgi:hypothetical protein
VRQVQNQKPPEQTTEYLISLHTQVGVALHAYIISRGVSEGEVNKRCEGIINKLCAVAEEQGWPYLPVILQTRLTTGGDIVREVLSQDKEAMAKARRALDGTDNFHLSMFTLAIGGGDDKKLMKLH